MKKKVLLLTISTSIFNGINASFYLLFVIFDYISTNSNLNTKSCNISKKIINEIVLDETIHLIIKVASAAAAYVHCFPTGAGLTRN